MPYSMFDPQGRYRGLPGQSLYSPILEQPEIGVGLDDSTAGMDADNQVQVDALPAPAIIPKPPTPTTGPARAIATAPPPAPSGDPSAYDRLQHMAPRPAAPQPKWYQRLAAAGVGALAGAANAGGRTRIPTDQIQQAEQNILEPGYAQDVGEWEENRADLENQAKLEFQRAQQQSLDESRGESAQYRRSMASTDAREATDRAQAARERIAQQQSESNRKFLQDRLKGREADATYQAVGASRPPNWEYIDDPEKAGFGFAVPPSWVKLEKDMVPYAPGRHEGDMIPWSEFRAAQKSAATSQVNIDKPARYGGDQQAYIDAAGGDIQKGLAAWEAGKTRLAAAGRTPREPSAAQLAGEQKATVRKLAQRAMNESRTHGGPNYDDAIRNVQQHYQQDPEMDDNRDDVIAQLNAWKISGLRPDQLQGTIDKQQGAFITDPATGKLKLRTPGSGGGRGGAGGAAPPPPAATSGRAAPAVGQVKYLANGQAVRITAIRPDGRIEYVPAQ